jgi:heme/copper-type cytochrome/quinol oxidase subunit 1
MSPLTVRCIKAAFIYLALGIGLGASFAIDRAFGAGLRTLHAEFNLWGWSTLLIYGMGYHMLPRFTGQPLRWPRLAEVQSWLAIGGVALTALGWLGTRYGLPLAQVWLIGGASVQLVAASAFGLQIVRLLR